MPTTETLCKFEISDNADGTLLATGTYDLDRHEVVTFEFVDECARLRAFEIRAADRAAEEKELANA